MASLPLLLAYQINTAIVIPVAKSAPTLFLRTKTEMNLYGMIFKVNMSRIQVLYKAIAVLLQNNKTHCKGYKVHSRRRYLGGLPHYS
jgi:hypothetical protein